MIEVSDEELNEFCQWYKEHYGNKESSKSSMSTCLCGRFQTYTRAANRLIDRLNRLGLIENKKDVIILK